MNKYGDLFKTADWKNEKHVPVIECTDAVKAGEKFSLSIAVGKEIAHPNTTAHHIRWISVQFQPEGETVSCQIGHFEFSAHGESAQGPDTGPAYTSHEVSLTLTLSKSGTIFATSLCNIHGLWESSQEIKVS